MTDIVFAHDGTVAKIIGDAIHVLFGAPGEQPDHAARAVVCALALDDYASVHLRTLSTKRSCARRYTHRRPCRAGDCRQVRRRPLFRLHRLWRYHQCRGASRSRQQATRHPHLRECDTRGKSERISRAGRSATLCFAAGPRRFAPSSRFGLNNIKLPPRRLISMPLPNWRPTIPARSRHLHPMSAKNRGIIWRASTSSGSSMAQRAHGLRWNSAGGSRGAVCRPNPPDPAKLRRLTAGAAARATPRSHRQACAAPPTRREIGSRASIAEADKTLTKHPVWDIEKHLVGAANLPP